MRVVCINDRDPSDGSKLRYITYREEYNVIEQSVCMGCEQPVYRLKETGTFVFMYQECAQCGNLNERDHYVYARSRFTDPLSFIKNMERTQILQQTI